MCWYLKFRQLFENLYMMLLLQNPCELGKKVSSSSHNQGSCCKDPKLKWLYSGHAKNTAKWGLVLAKNFNWCSPVLQASNWCAKSFRSSFSLSISQGYLSISPWVTNEKFWGLLSTINFHSRAASQPRNSGNCHTLVKFMGDNCPQINNSICKMLLGVGQGKNSVSSAVYSFKDFNSLLYNICTF